MVVATKTKSGRVRGRASDGRKRPESTAAHAKVSKPPSFIPQDLDFGDLELLDELQMRLTMDASHIQEMIDFLRGAEKQARKLPRIKVFRITDGRFKGKYCVIDGYHRCAAYLETRTRIIPCVVMEGTFFEALTAAAAANKEHLGLKRSSKDKRRAVERFLVGLAKAGENWTDRRIAEHVGVHHDLVGDVRTLLAQAGLLADSATRTGADGRLLLADSATRKSKYALPQAFSCVAIGKQLALPAPVQRALFDAGISTAGDFYSHFKVGDLCGLERGQADQVRDEIRKLYVDSATAAAERNPGAAHLAAFRCIASKFSRYAIEQVALWWRQRSWDHKNPKPPAANRLDDIRPTNADEVAIALSRLTALDEFSAGPRADNFFEAIHAEPSLPGPTPEAPAEPLPKTPPTFAKKAPRSEKRSMYGPGFTDLVVNGLHERAQHDPKLAGLKKRLKLPATNGAEPNALEAAEQAWQDVPLATVPKFSVPIAGGLGLRGIRTIGDLVARIEAVSGRDYEKVDRPFEAIKQVFNAILKEPGSIGLLHSVDAAFDYLNAHPRPSASPAKKASCA